MDCDENENEDDDDCTDESLLHVNENNNEPVKKKKKTKKNKNKESNNVLLTSNNDKVKESVEEKLKNINLFSGISDTEIPKKVASPMHFEVSDLTSTNLKKRKNFTPSSPQKTSPHKSKRATFEVSELPKECSFFDNDQNDNNFLMKSLSLDSSPEEKEKDTLTLNLSTNKKKFFSKKNSPKNVFSSPWEEPLKDGEIEYFIKSRKQISKEKKSKKLEKTNINKVIMYFIYFCYLVIKNFSTI